MNLCAHNTCVFSTSVKACFKNEVQFNALRHVLKLDALAAVFLRPPWKVLKTGLPEGCLQDRAPGHFGQHQCWSHDRNCYTFPPAPVPTGEKPHSIRNPRLPGTVTEACSRVKTHSQSELRRVIFKRNCNTSVSWNAPETANLVAVRARTRGIQVNRDA